MTNENSNIDSKEAKIALESIQNLEAAALNNAMPPIWLGLAISAVIGMLVFLVGAGLRDYYVFPIIALPIIIAIYRNKTSSSVRSTPNGMKGVAALLTLIAFMIMLMFIGMYTREMYAMFAGPFVCSVIAALTVFWLSISERKEYQHKIDKGVG